jgi:hypothetical protein
MICQALKKKYKWSVALIFEEIPDPTDALPVPCGVGQKNPGAFRITHLRSLTFED